MNTNRTTATIVGVLYIIGTVAGLLCAVIAGPILAASDYLARIPANENQLTVGAFSFLVMGLALALIPVLMFPILKRHNEALALGYVVFRGGLETVTVIAWSILVLSLLPLSRAYVQAGAPDAAGLEPLGILLLGAKDLSFTFGEIVFALGAMMFYVVLYRSRLIPRWLSGWGLIVAVPYLAAGLLHLFGLISLLSTTQTVLVAPMALQEMVMAGWLIAKGFSLPEPVAGPVRSALQPAAN